MVRFFKKNKKWFISVIFITYLIHFVPVYLQKNSFVDLDPKPDEFTLLLTK